MAKTKLLSSTASAPAPSTAATVAATTKAARSLSSATSDLTSAYSSSPAQRCLVDCTSLILSYLDHRDFASSLRTCHRYYTASTLPTATPSIDYPRILDSLRLHPFSIPDLESQCGRVLYASRHGGFRRPSMRTISQFGPPNDPWKCVRAIACEVWKPAANRRDAHPHSLQNHFTGAQAVINGRCRTIEALLVSQPTPLTLDLSAPVAEEDDPLDPPPSIDDPSCVSIIRPLVECVRDTLRILVTRSAFDRAPDVSKLVNLRILTTSNVYHPNVLRSLVNLQHLSILHTSVELMKQVRYLSRYHSLTSLAVGWCKSDALRELCIGGDTDDDTQAEEESRQRRNEKEYLESTSLRLSHSFSFSSSPSSNSSAFASSSSSSSFSHHNSSTLQLTHLSMLHAYQLSPSASPHSDNLLVLLMSPSIPLLTSLSCVGFGSRLAPLLARPIIDEKPEATRDASWTHAIDQGGITLSHREYLLQRLRMMEELNLQPEASPSQIAAAEVLANAILAGGGGENGHAEANGDEANQPSYTATFSSLSTFLLSILTSLSHCVNLRRLFLRCTTPSVILSSNFMKRMNKLEELSIEAYIMSDQTEREWEEGNIGNDGTERTGASSPPSIFSSIPLYSLTHLTSCTSLRSLTLHCDITRIWSVQAFSILSSLPHFEKWCVHAQETPVELTDQMLNEIAKSETWKAIVIHSYLYDWYRKEDDGSQGEKKQKMKNLKTTGATITSTGTVPSSSSSIIDIASLLTTNATLRHFRVYFASHVYRLGLSEQQDQRSSKKNRRLLEKSNAPLPSSSPSSYVWYASDGHLRPSLESSSKSRRGSNSSKCTIM